MSLKVFEISAKQKIRSIDYVRSHVELGKDAFGKGVIGYELVEEVSKVVDVNEGTIYPLLKRLTNEHYFETYLRESKEGPPRKYYHLTAAGVLYRDSLEKEWNELTEKVGGFLEECRNG